MAGDRLPGRKIRDVLGLKAGGMSKRRAFDPESTRGSPPASPLEGEESPPGPRRRPPEARFPTSPTNDQASLVRPVSPLAPVGIRLLPTAVGLEKRGWRARLESNQRPLA